MNLTLLGSIFPKRETGSFSDNKLPAWARIAPNCPIIETQIVDGKCGNIFSCDKDMVDEENPPAPTADEYELQAWQSMGRYKGALLVYPYNAVRVARVTDKNYLMLCCKKKEDDTPLVNNWVPNLPTDLVTVGWMKTRPKYMAPTIFIYRVVYDTTNHIVYIGNNMYNCDTELVECQASAYATLLNDDEAEVVLNTKSGLLLLKGGVDYGSVGCSVQ